MSHDEVCRHFYSTNLYKYVSPTDHHNAFINESIYHSQLIANSIIENAAERQHDLGNKAHQTYKCQG